ncbi:MAG: tetratricopeptide repeat protein, partial [Planctomycetota bacterium]
MLRESSPTALKRRSGSAIRLFGLAAAFILSAPASMAPAGDAAGEPDPALAGDPLYQEFLRVNYVFNRELYELCIPRYEKILAAKPGPALAPHVRYALALCHYHLASKAEERGSSALASVAPGAAVRSGTGGAVEGKAAQHARKAIEHLRAAVLDRKFGARAAATVTLGQTFLLLGDPASAAQAFAWVLERGSAPEDIEAALAGLADAKYRSEDFEGAARAYRQILERAPAGGARERAEFALGLSIYRKLERSAPAEFRESAEADECEKVLAGIAARPESPLAGDAAYMLALLQERRGDD